MKYLWVDIKTGQLSMANNKEDWNTTYVKGESQYKCLGPVSEIKKFLNAKSKIRKGTK